MSDEHAIRVLLVDDHPVILEGLHALLSRAPRMRVVAQADSGAGVLQAFAVHRPDVTLLDLGLPDMSGVEVIERVRARDPRARFLVLTMRGGSEDIYLAVRAGCRGYLLKNARREELLRAIETVHAGGRHFPDAIARRLADRRREDELTDREREVLGLLVAGLRDKEIARNTGVSVTTVKTHLRNIHGKLGVSSRTQAILAALESGIVHSPDN